METCKRVPPAPPVCAVLCASQVRAEDEEVFEMNPIEYIRRDRCGQLLLLLRLGGGAPAVPLPFPANAAGLFVFLVHSPTALAVQSHRANVSNLLQPVVAALLGTVLHLYQPHASVAAGLADELGVVAPWGVLLLWLLVPTYCKAATGIGHTSNTPQGTMRVC